MRMNALGANIPLSVCAASPNGRWKPTSKPPLTAIPALTNPRRVSAGSSFLSGYWSIGLGMAVLRRTELTLRCLFDRRPDAHVGAASADVSRHGRIDVGIVGVGGGVEQSRRRHDLPGLTVSTLDDLQVEPVFLYFSARRRGAYAFNRGDRALADRADRQ